MDKKSQKQKVMSYIRKHGSITSVEAFKALGVTRLSAIIYYLKEDGFKIDSVTEIGKNGTHWSKYFENGRRKAKAKA